MAEDGWREVFRSHFESSSLYQITTTLFPKNSELYIFPSSPPVPGMPQRFSAQGTARHPPWAAPEDGRPVFFGLAADSSF